MPQQTPLTDYYELTYESNGTGGQFTFTVALAMTSATYMGDGSEFGNGAAPGPDQLRAIAQRIARGIEAKSAPAWDKIRLVAVNGQQTRKAQLPIPPDPPVVP